VSEKITVENQKLNIPDEVIIPYIEGDGIGPDITMVMKHVVGEAIKVDGKRIDWKEIPYSCFYQIIVL